MNKLNKKIISFVLSFCICLLVNVSYADWTITPINNQTNISMNYTSTMAVFGDYSMSSITALVKNYMNDPSTYETQYNSMVEYLENMDLALVFAMMGVDSYCFVFPNNIDVGFYNSNTYCFTGNGRVDHGSSAYSSNYYGDSTDSSCVYMKVNQTNSLFYSTKSVKNIAYANGYYWDGTYYYEVPTIPEEPILPTNSEITQAVQAFYNSDYYKNNKDFKDFIVMYNYNNQYFSFIGHNNEDKFQQLIFPAGYKYGEQWWKFGLDGLIDTASSYLFNKRYWLYSSNDFGETIAYNGEGYMKELLELKFSTSSIIVYSSNDYDVIYYTYNENNELTNEIETIPGDQYTYDENLDPTTNEYNPLENFVPTNPSQSILGNVDFNEINKTFEENKDILNIENASWLFTANNKLVGYFIGFLSLLIVFLIISRILGG